MSGGSAFGFGELGRGGFGRRWFSDFGIERASHETLGRIWQADVNPARDVPVRDFAEHELEGVPAADGLRDRLLAGILPAQDNGGNAGAIRVNLEGLAAQFLTLARE